MNYSDLKKLEMAIHINPTLFNRNTQENIQNLKDTDEQITNNNTVIPQAKVYDRNALNKWFEEFESLDFNTIKSNYVQSAKNKDISKNINPTQNYTTLTKDKNNIIEDVFSDIKNEHKHSETLFYDNNRLIKQLIPNTSQIFDSLLKDINLNKDYSEIISELKEKLEKYIKKHIENYIVNDDKENSTIPKEWANLLKTMTSIDPNNVSRIYEHFQKETYDINSIENTTLDTILKDYGISNSNITSAKKSILSKNLTSATELLFAIQEEVVKQFAKNHNISPNRYNTILKQLNDPDNKKDLEEENISPNKKISFKDNNNNEHSITIDSKNYPLICEDDKDFSNIINSLKKDSYDLLKNVLGSNISDIDLNEKFKNTCNSLKNEVMGKKTVDVISIVLELLLNKDQKHKTM